jgi:hypothetical protein
MHVAAVYLRATADGCIESVVIHHVVVMATTTGEEEHKRHATVLPPLASDADA